MRQISCRGCREWFDAGQSFCPHCDWERPGLNRWLVTVEMNNHLLRQAEEQKPVNVYSREYRRYKSDLDRIARDL